MGTKAVRVVVNRIPIKVQGRISMAQLERLFKAGFYIIHTTTPLVSSK